MGAGGGLYHSQDGGSHEVWGSLALLSGSQGEEPHMKSSLLYKFTAAEEN